MTATERIRRAAQRAARASGFEIRRLPIGASTSPVDEADGTPSIFADVSPTCQIPNLVALYDLCFGRKASGAFVEVGAFDGHSFSNTSCLVSAGWSGLFVEPVPEYADRCAARYESNPRVEVARVAVGGHEGRVELYVGESLSTADAELHETYRHLPWAASSLEHSRVITVPQTTLDALLEAHGVAVGFDLLVVDVEGLEPAVFHGMDLERWSPSVMIVELADVHRDLVHQRASSARLYLDICASGYVPVYKDEINTFFVRGDLYRRWCG